MLFVSATPVYEEEHELLRAEQIIRPTGLLDPDVDVRPVEGQIDDLIRRVNKETANQHKVLDNYTDEAYGRRSDRLYERSSASACDICIRILILWKDRDHP